MTTTKREFNPAGWFEIPVSDMQRAKNFYEAVFRLPIDVMENEGGTLMGTFPMSESACGISGSLVQGKGYVPTLGGLILYFSEPDIDAALDRIREHGGNIITGKTDIGQYGWYAWFEDTEGNRLGLHAMPK